MELTIRNRIALYYTVASGLVAVMLFLAIYSVVYQTVFRHLNDDLKAESREIINSLVILNDQFIFANPNEWTEREHGQIEVNPTFVEVTDSVGHIIRKTGNLFEGHLEFRPEVEKTTYFNSHLSGARTRQLQLPITNQVGKTLGYLLVAIPLEESEMVLQNLSYVLLFSFPVGILVLFFVAQLIAGKSIAPIERVISTAEDISRESLDRRIPLPVHRDELYRLSSTVNALMDRLQEAFLREQQFTADASHELRTPLAVLKGTLEVLIRKPRTADQYEKKIKYCIGEADRMSALVEQLLLLARYDSGSVKPALKRVNLSDILENALVHGQPLWESKKFTLDNRLEKSLSVNADPAMLNIVLENILSNAVKYSADDCHIAITSRKNEKGVSLTVADNGIGMTKKQVEQIFDRFYRADESRNFETPGLGLGMAIVKRLSDLQNIRISVDSFPGKGTRITLLFPLTVPEQ